MAKYEKEKQVKKGKNWINAEEAGKEAKRVYSSIKGQKGSAFTKMAKDYLEISNKVKELKKVENELKKNVETKMLEIFDDEADALFTRVAESSGVVAQLAKDAQKKTSKFDLEKFVQKMNESNFAPEIIEGLNCMLGECTEVKDSVSKGSLKVSLAESKLGDFLGKASKGASAIIKKAFSAIKKKLSKTNKSLDSKWDKLQNVIGTLQREEKKALNESISPVKGLFESLVLQTESTAYDLNDLASRIETSLREIRFSDAQYDSGKISDIVQDLAPKMGADNSVKGEEYNELLSKVTDVLTKEKNDTPDFNDLASRIETGLREIRFSSAPYDSGEIIDIVTDLAPKLGIDNSAKGEEYNKLLSEVIKVLTGE